MLQTLNTYLNDHRERLVDQWLELTAIPAPSGSEQARAAAVERFFQAAGLQNVRYDMHGNIIGTRPHTAGRPTVVVAPHMDTVFGPEINTNPSRAGNRIYAPGVRDNTAGVAVTIAALQAMQALQLPIAATLVFAATVKEEVGLQGMGGFLDGFKEPIDCVIAVDGHLGSVIHGGPGIRWLEVTMDGPGGHAWQDFGLPSAVHTAGNIIHTLNNLSIPREPKTTWNVGTIRGGTVTNAIAEQCVMTFDLRSESQAALDDLTDQLQKTVHKECSDAEIRYGVRELTTIPAGCLPGGADHPLAKAARAVLAEIHQPTNSVVCAATDANQALARRIPALAIGGTTGGGVHTVDEYANVEPFFNGIRQLVLLLERIPQLLQD